ncbi:hypothetical protein QTP86_006742 [Hemibagrus guttatus]|nr:hypothetical protein QTP86_006742 [Hemibagrus guttatus]
MDILEHRSTEDAVSTVLQSVLTHLDNNNTHAHVLFVDFSFAFNTVIPSKLTTKLGDLGINTSLHNWIMDFLTNRPQHVRSGHSTTTTLNSGVPQGCVLSPFLYSLFIQDCRPVYGSNSIIKFADDTMMISFISNNDETAYRAEVQHWAAWCADNNLLLLLNTSKAKELIVDFRREKGRTDDPIHIHGMAVECVCNFKILGTHISEDLSLTTNNSSLIKKAHQCLFVLNTLKKNHLSSTILVNF